MNNFKREFLKYSNNADKFFHSKYFLIVLTLITLFGFMTNFKIPTMAALIFLMSINLISSKDITPVIVTILFICIIPLDMYGAQWNQFAPYIGFIIFLAISFIAHIIIFPVKVELGKLFLPIVVYSFALIIGGVGYISMENYFKASTLYYILCLGPLMIILYMLYKSYIPKNVTKSIDLFTNSMFFIGILIILMWIFAILEEIPNYGDTFYIPYRQWKNNIGNYTLLTMPFSFYLATKKRFSIMYFLIGFLQFAAIVFSQSRGATIMAVIALPFLFAYTFKYSSKKNYAQLSICFLAMFVFALSFFLMNRNTIFEVLQSAISHEDSGRLSLYKEAIKNFLDSPIVGVGIGHRNDDVYIVKNMGMFWYHSTIMQVLGSMGIIGLIAYVYQMVVRLKILIKNNSFNIFALIAFVSFEGYSMVNTGDFAPLPFVAWLTFLFAICEKNNDYNKIRSNDIKDIIYKK